MRFKEVEVGGVVYYHVSKSVLDICKRGRRVSWTSPELKGPFVEEIFQGVQSNVT